MLKKGYRRKFLLNEYFSLHDGYKKNFSDTIKKRASIDMDMTNYQPEDFLTDDSFINWATRSDKASIEKWKRWLLENPDKQHVVDRALAILDNISVHENVPHEQVQTAESRLINSIHQTSDRPARVISVKRKLWWAIAAAFLLLIAGTVIWKMYSLPPAVQTDYGQIEKHNLPDGSEVTLNANSTISYSKTWNEGKDREVWIKGEAFFHVKKTAEHSRFIVHANHFDIIVTGTQFNVVNREGVTNVMLTEGSVTIKTDDGKEIKMKPGDFVELDKEQPEKKEVKKENVLAWQEHKVVFERTPMTEVVKTIEQLYGVKIKLADEVASNTISGMLPNDNLEVLLQSLEATADFKITKTDDTIVITRP